jgi:hypothetical protein
VKLALIPPNSLREVPWTQMTDLELILPWQVGLTTGDRLQPAYRILDNGAAEGDIAPLNKLANLCKEEHFDEVVAPDRLRDVDAAIEGARSMQHFKEQIGQDINIMAVVQGNNFAEVLKCYNAYTGFSWIDTIGVPRVLNEQFGMVSRLNLLQQISQQADNYPKPVHCLGAYYGFPEEIRYLADMDGIVRSMDSSLPFVLGCYGMNFDYPPHMIGALRRPTGYFDLTIDEAIMEVMEVNVRRYIHWSKR